MTLPPRVEGAGPGDARLMVIGEAPGVNEELRGVPFCGATGDMIAEDLSEAGTSIHDIYRTNIVKIRPPDNDLSRLREYGLSVSDFLEEIVREVNIINPNCILLVGDTALSTLTSCKGIQKWRGSIVRTMTNHKAVACIHPAALFTHGDAQLPWINRTIIKQDIQRAVKQSLFKDIILPSRNLLIAKSSLDVIRYMERWAWNDKCVVDVETFKTFPLCIGLGHSAHEAISIPTFSEDISPHETAYIWKIIAEYFADSKVKLVAQNMKFDQKRCRQLGLGWSNPWMDIAMAWHVLWSEMPKKLQFISSFLTEEPYYKDEGKEYNPKKDKIERLFMYNAKDCVVEYECMERILETLEEEGLTSFFFDKIMPLHNLYSDIEDVGLMQDQDVRSDLLEHYKKLRTSQKEILTASVIKYGHMDSFRLKARKNKQDVIKEVLISEMNCDSPPQMKALIFGYLGCPLRADVGEASLKALANNGVKDAARKDIIKGILEDRKIGKTIGTYLESRFGTYPISEYTPFKGTKRIFTQCNLNGTSSGRTSTGVCKPPVSPIQHGIALQTMTKHEDVTLSAGGGDLRSMFVSDPGWSLVEADGAGAEDRVVVVLCKDWPAFEQLNKKEYKYNKHGLKDDRHTLTAMAVTDKAFEDITDYDRQIGKRTRHAGNYDMGKHQAMLTFGKYGLFLSEWKCGKLLEAFHAANPAIKNVFHAEIQDALQLNNRKLVAPQGRVEVFFERWGTELFKQAYSFLPQATVTDAVKFAMLRIAARVDRRWFHFCGESHDSCLALVKDEYIPEAANVIRTEMEQPISFRKCTLARDYDLVIPCDIKCGKRWVDKSEKFPDGMKKWKG
jgi:DNA polymerase